jgi:hypothetical protein
MLMCMYFICVLSMLSAAAAAHEYGKDLVMLRCNDSSSVVAVGTTTNIFHTTTCIPRV